MNYLHYTMTLALVMLLCGCGRWTEVSRDYANVVLSDGEKYHIALKHRDYEFTEHVHSPTVTLRETNNALAGEKYWFSLTLQEEGNREVAHWDGKPGYSLLLIQRYLGKTYAAFNKFDPNKSMGWIFFYVFDEGTKTWNELEPASFPGFIAICNIQGNTVRTGPESEYPWRVISSTELDPFPKFHLQETGQLWHAIGANNRDADYRKYPNFIEVLKQFKAKFGREPGVDPKN